MTFTRGSILGSAGLVLLPLLACSTSKQSAQADGSGARERVDKTPVGVGADTEVSSADPQPKEACDYRPGERLDFERLTTLKWKNTLPRPRELAPKPGTDNEYEITARKQEVQMLPDCYPTTSVFAYGGLTLGLGETEPRESFTTPGPTLEMTRDTAAQVTWINDIEGEHPFAIDPTLHWANPKKYQDPPVGPFTATPPIDPRWQSPVPIVTHVHGLEVAPASDGAPEAWFTRGWLDVGSQFPRGPNGALEKTSYYPNEQPPTTLWYHDHALGITRLNVYAGLAGMYIIRDDDAHIDLELPDRAHEMPLVIQDRSFNPDGSLNYPTNFSEHHPYWASAFFGDVMVVNGKLWPKMPVERTRYRFRVLNGANYRSFNLSLTRSEGAPPPFTVIGSDGGYLAAPADTQLLKLAPGERADVVIDFSTLRPGESLILSNDGEDVVKFEVPEVGPEPKASSCKLDPKATDDESKPALPPCFPDGLEKNDYPLDLQGKPDSTRTVTLIDAGSHSLLLNGQMFHGDVTEKVKLGTTEDWDIVNTTLSDHPIHLHLVQFKLLERKAITEGYLEKWQAENGTELPLHHAANNPPVDDYRTGDPLPIEVAETGWKDTIVVPGSSVTRIRVRWTPQDTTDFPFNPAQAPGYLWHCHMLEHEDNEMMRPLEVVE